MMAERDDAWSAAGLTDSSMKAVKERKEVLRQIESMDAEKVKKDPFLIDPRTANWLAGWDCGSALALAFTAMMTPYEVSFMQEEKLFALFIANRVIDLVFVLDILLQFFMAYPEQASSSAIGSLWITDRRRIRWHYLTSNFALDFMSTAVSAFDIVSFISDDAGLAKFKVLRVLRVLRLVKLLRLLRGMRIFKRWETRLSIDYSMLSLVQSVVLVLMVAHWSACFWMLQASFSADIRTTWLADKGYCVDASDADLSVYVDPSPLQDTYVCVYSRTLYAACLYFAVMTITSIGYGDMSATAANGPEMMMCTRAQAAPSLGVSPVGHSSLDWPARPSATLRMSAAPRGGRAFT